MSTDATDPADPMAADRARLERVRDEIEARIESGPGAADLAALSRELRQVIATLRDFPAPAAAAGIDQIKAAREKRQAAS